MLEQYLTTSSHDSKIRDFDDPEFGTLYNKHVSRFYLDNVTNAMLGEIKPDFTHEEFKNIRSWVFAFGHTILERERIATETKSNQIKEIIKTRINETIVMVLGGTNSLGFETQAREKKYRIVQNSSGKVFLMKPHARTKGYSLESVTILSAQI